MIQPPEVRAAGISVCIGRKRLVDGINLTLPPGSLTVLLGPNGAGKTTLLRVLAGVLAPTAGEVQLGGQPLGRLSRTAIARRCAYLPQQGGTSFALRVEDVVALGRYPHLGGWGTLTREDYARIHAAMARVGIEPLRDRALPTLSGGERQRVFLARALAQAAPVLLLDEPAAALDLGWQMELLRLLTELHRDGYTVLAALHDLHAAVDFFPRAVLLDRGRLVAEENTEQVLRGPELAAAFGVQARRAEGWYFEPAKRW